MMRAHFTCWYMDDLRGFGPHFSVSLIAFFHMMVLLLPNRLLIFFVRAKTYFLLIVVCMSKFEQRFKLTVNFLARLCFLSFRVIGEIDMGEGLHRFFYVGEFIYQRFQCQAIL